MLEKLYCLIEGDSTQLALSNGTIIMEFLKCLHIVRYFCQHLYCQHGNYQLPVPGCTRLLEPPSIREYSFSITYVTCIVQRAMYTFSHLTHQIPTKCTRRGNSKVLACSYVLFQHLYCQHGNCQLHTCAWLHQMGLHSTNTRCMYLQGHNIFKEARTLSSQWNGGWTGVGSIKFARGSSSRCYILHTPLILRSPVTFVILLLLKLVHKI